MELNVKLRDKDHHIERLERDRRWLANREREEKERQQSEYEEAKVSRCQFSPNTTYQQLV
jgi:mitotic spindle assembly checkpoint protein MAD1